MSNHGLTRLKGFHIKKKTSWVCHECKETVSLQSTFTYVYECMIDKLWKHKSTHTHTQKCKKSTTSCKEYNIPSQAYNSLQWLASATLCNDTISLWAMHRESILEDNPGNFHKSHEFVPKMAGLCRFRMQIKSHRPRWLVNKKIEDGKKGTPFNSLQKQLPWTSNANITHNFDCRSFKHNNMLSS